MSTVRVLLDDRCGGGLAFEDTGGCLCTECGSTVGCVFSGILADGGGREMKG